MSLLPFLCVNTIESEQYRGLYLEALVVSKFMI